MRWHTSTCHQPDVYVAEDGAPTCRGCGKSAQEMRRPREDTGTSLETLPPDEPEGHLGLWWPPSVPYSSNDSPVEIKNNKMNSTNEFTLSEVKPDVQKASSKPSLSSASLENGQIYERALRPSEFRLACLSATPSKSDTTYPIHLSFDIFEDDHCPEYDAVSYAWGGEDNNRDHNSPIYIGEYWDILHATRNCWAVLRYLRPWKGTRFIWLDFVCINQRDMEEKVRQIRKMGQIYSQCSQVFLWLGEDAVCHDQVALPSRRPLEDLEDIHKILSRKYFTRVWVIQELVLSRRISMPYVDIVYEASSQSLRHIEQTLAASPAPWLKIATQGSSHDLSWTEVMRLTSQAKSSDVRDGLYGILGLWPSDNNLPPPTYAISYQHMMMGLFAWSLTCERNLSILYAARGVSPAGFEDALPSWAPSFRNHHVWEWLVEASSLDQIDYHNGLKLGSWITEEGSADPPDIEALTNSDGQPWDFQIAIDRDSGRLSLWTTKIRDTQSDYWKVEDYKPPSWIEHQMLTCSVWVSSCGLFIISPKNPNGLVKSGDELHLLTRNNSKESYITPAYVFLRKVADQSYKLILRVPMVYFKMIRTEPFLSLNEIREDRSCALDIIEEIWDLPMYRFETLSDRSGSLHESVRRDLQRAFPGNENTPFHVLLAVILDDCNFERLLDNDTARRLEARIETAQGIQNAPQYLTLKFRKPDWEVSRSLYEIGWREKRFAYIFFQSVRLGVASKEEVEFTEDWTYTPYAYASGRCSEYETEQIRHQEVMYVACEVESIRLFLREIDELLCITNIWRTLGLSNPKGTWDELRHAQSVYKRGLVAPVSSSRSYSGNCDLVGLESRIHII